MCQFPARLLLRQCHEAAALADASGDHATMTYACGFIKAVGDAGRFHEDLTGCGCWYEANQARRPFGVRSERGDRYAERSYPQTWYDRES